MLLVVLLGGLVLAAGRRRRRRRPARPARRRPSGARAVAELLRDQGVTVDLVHDDRRDGARPPGPATPCWSSTPTCWPTARSRRCATIGADLVLVDRDRPGPVRPGRRRVEPTGARGARRRAARCRRPAARARPTPARVGYDVADADLGRRAALLRAGRRAVAGAGPGRRPAGHAARRVVAADQRPARRRGQRRARPRPARRPATGWSGTCPSPADVPAVGAEVVLRPGPRRRRLGAGAARRRGAAAGAVAGPAARRRSSPSRCRSSCGPPRRSRAGPGSTGAAAPAGRPPRRCAPAYGTGWRPPLGLPRRAEPPAVVAAVAARSGRPGPDVAALLYGAAPADDAALVRLADDLDALEREVRRP